MELEEQKIAQATKEDKNGSCSFFREDKAKEALDALAVELEGLKAMNERIAGNDGGAKDAE